MKPRTRILTILGLVLGLAIEAGAGVPHLYTVNHYSEALQKETAFNVLMPAEAEPGQRYPVMYLLHGAWGSYVDWAAKTDIEKYAEQYEFIIVMPDGGQFGWYVDSPVEATSAYETYITRELVQTVDRLLPTISSREGRSLCGLSMGGHGALSLAAKHPDLYSCASSLSGILRIAAHPEKYHIENRLGAFEAHRDRWEANSVYELSERFVGADVRLLFDVGVKDTKTGAFEDSRQCHERFTELGLEHVYREFPGTHSWAYWDEHVQEHLVFHAENFADRLGRLVSKEQKRQREALNKWHRHYFERLEKFRIENEKLRACFPDKKTVVLLGSSSCELFFRNRDLLPGWFALDRGISADSIGLGQRGILHRLKESVFDCNPEHVFILNGRNDLGGTVRTGTPKVEEIAAGYQKVIEKILEGVPGVKVHVVSCFPTRDKYEKMAPLVGRYNAQLERIARQLGVDYIDVYSQLVDEDGLLRPEYSSDGLHVKGDAYQIWADAMKEALAKETKELNAAPCLE